jgi:arylsulfatase A-like enzyme
MSKTRLSADIGAVMLGASKAVRARFKGVLLGSAVALATLTGATLQRPATASAQAKPAERMNVLFIIADDLRSGSAFDANVAKTPNVDALAARGVRFDEAQCQFPLCGPSRASMLSGRRPNTIRVFDLNTSIRAADPDLVTMPQHFRQNGYYTAAVGKLHHQGVPGTIGLPPEYDPHNDKLSWTEAYKPIGVDKDDEWDGKLVNPAKANPGIAMAWYADESGKPHTDELVATKAIELINQHKDKPFFIAAGFYRPHVPDIAPKAYFDIYPDVRWTPESHADTSGVKRTQRDYGLNVAEQRQFVQAYYASMTYMDAQVGRILDGLKKAGVADKTIVVFTSDHGFNLGEHNHWQKTQLWRDSTRVPLVIYTPKAKGNGKASPKLVELLDLYPTLSDLAGLPSPKGVEGHSLRPLIENPTLAKWDYPAQSQVVNGRSVRFENWRYSEWGKNAADGAELYNLKTDPGEYRNLAALPENAAVVAKLKAMLPGDPPPAPAQKVPGEQELYKYVPGGRQGAPQPRS